MAVDDDGDLIAREAERAAQALVVARLGGLREVGAERLEAGVAGWGGLLSGELVEGGLQHATRPRSLVGARRVGIGRGERGQIAFAIVRVERERGHGAATLLRVVVAAAVGEKIPHQREQKRTKAPAVGIGLFQPFAREQVAEKILRRILGIPARQSAPPGKGVGRPPVSAAETVKRRAASRIVRGRQHDAPNGGPKAVGRAGDRGLERAAYLVGEGHGG